MLYTKSPLQIVKKKWPNMKPFKIRKQDSEQEL